MHREIVFLPLNVHAYKVKSPCLGKFFHISHAVLTSKSDIITVDFITKRLPVCSKFLLSSSHTQSKNMSNPAKNEA